MRLLDLAAPSAEVIHVRKDPNGPAWQQPQINALLVARTAVGKRVMRLKYGDPGVFDLGGEEAAALSAARLAWKIVPGVTSASATCAAAGGFWAEHGANDTLVLATSQLRAGAEAPDWASHLRPGAAIALDMGVKSAPQMQAGLLQAGHSPDLSVDVIAGAETPR